MVQVKVPVYWSVGGGPGGSYAATLLQREGHQVVLMEAATFPRYHIGESMLPSLRDYLRFIDLEDEVAKHGFCVKPGATFKLSRDVRESYTDFSLAGPNCTAWNVIRSEMDDLLLRNARKHGVQVFEETRVTDIDFGGDPESSRPVAAHWSNKAGASGSIKFDWLIDASGRAGIMSTKYLRNRVMRESLRNVAVWGYWTGVRGIGDGTERAGSPWFEALTDEQGWAWAIPLHDGTTSVGVVMHSDASKAKKDILTPEGQKPTLTEHYLDQLKFLPGVRALIGDTGKFIPGSTKSASDYSYFATRYSGDHFRIIGDAGNFVDPFFSSGVHIAMVGAISAALTICASLNGETEEKLAQEWHDAKVGIAHTRFLFVVLGAYQQMHIQTAPILGELDEENFDRAFDMFRPVIFGIADTSAKLTSDKVQNMMNVFEQLFDPRTHEDDIAEARRRYGAELVSMDAPILGKDAIDNLTKDDEVTKRVFEKMDALKGVASEYRVTDMESQPIVGYVARMQRGRLGLELAPSKVG